jgi:hypothetical protein
MTGSITRLIDDRQVGTIAGEDGIDYTFRDGSLIGVTFGSLGLGARVVFAPGASAGKPQATSVRIAPK